MGSSAVLITAGSAAAAKTKTYRDTNMQNSNVVPTKLFKFIGVSIAFYHQSDVYTNSKDREYIRDSGYMQFRIVDKDILFLPLVCLPEVNPIIASSTTVNNVSVNSYAGGGGNNVPMYKFPIPITLNPYENFQVSLNFDGTITTTASVDIMIILQGYMRRPT